MEKLTLLVLAAGLGSRYGGLKQIEPMGPNGEILIDYSIYDAAQAGFSKVVFIVKRELRDMFHETVGARAGRLMEVDYAFQDQDAFLPDGFNIPEGRRDKPWGTAHALLCARAHTGDSPFVVINADDFYGRESYILLKNFLDSPDGCAERPQFAMAGYVLKNTLSKNGLVARGVCETDMSGYLTDINERLKIGFYEGGVMYEGEDGQRVFVNPDAVVSLNIWAFTPEVYPLVLKQRDGFFKGIKRPEKDEFLLPAAIGHMIHSSQADVRVLTTGARWYGVTYKEDREPVKKALMDMHKKNIYPALR